MKRRTPVYINIVIVLGLLLVVFYMFSQTSDFLTSKYFLGTALISIIVVFIQTAIGDLIENEKFKKLTDGEKAAYLTEKKYLISNIFGMAHLKAKQRKKKKTSLSTTVSMALWSLTISFQNGGWAFSTLV